MRGIEYSGVPVTRPDQDTFKQKKLIGQQKQKLVEQEKFIADAIKTIKRLEEKLEAAEDKFKRYFKEASDKSEAEYKAKMAGKK